MHEDFESVLKSFEEDIEAVNKDITENIEEDKEDADISDNKKVLKSKTLRKTKKLLTLTDQKVYKKNLIMSIMQVF